MQQSERGAKNAIHYIQQGSREQDKKQVLTDRSIKWSLDELMSHPHLLVWATSK